MKKAAKIMYTIALVFTIIALIFAIITDISGLLAMLGVVKRDGTTDAAMSWQAAGGMTLGVGIYLTIVYIISIIFLCWAKKSFDNGNVVPHIIALVVGVISGNIFLILGGIFGILAIKQ